MNQKGMFANATELSRRIGMDLDKGIQGENKVTLEHPWLLQSMSRAVGLPSGASSWYGSFCLDVVLQSPDTLVSCPSRQPSICNSLSKTEEL